RGIPAPPVGSVVQRPRVGLTMTSTAALVKASRLFTAVRRQGRRIERLVPVPGSAAPARAAAHDSRERSMPALVVLVAVLAVFALGYRTYSAYLAEKVYGLDPDRATPAHELGDGVDYVATNKHVLFGHHFTSVAGAAPIVGPAIAVFWGWLPALLWVVLGTIFFAGVHDFGALWASSRNKGKSIGALSEGVIGKRTRSLFLIVVFLLLLMVNAVFGVIIAQGFVATPGSVFPAWMAIVVALIIGQLLRRNFSLALLTAVGVVVLYVSIWAGTFIEWSLPATMFGLTATANWIIILF